MIFEFEDAKNLRIGSCWSKNPLVSDFIPAPYFESYNILTNL